MHINRTEIKKKESGQILIKQYKGLHFLCACTSIIHNKEGTEDYGGVRVYLAPHKYVEQCHVEWIILICGQSNIITMLMKHEQKKIGIAKVLHAGHGHEDKC